MLSRSTINANALREPITIDELYKVIFSLQCYICMHVTMFVWVDLALNFEADIFNRLN